MTTEHVSFTRKVFDMAKCNLSHTLKIIFEIFIALKDFRDKECFSKLVSG